MTDYLAPMNYNRARDTLHRLGAFSSYTPEGTAEMRQILRSAYPMVFSRLQQKDFRNGALLLETQGSGQMGPLVFLSHLDVAPDRQEPKKQSEDSLCAPLGRAHLIALLEALEALLYDGYVPSGDLILCISFDGLSGGLGTKAMADHLRSRAVHPCFVLDAGGFVSEDSFRTFLRRMPIGITPPLAMIGITEKAELQGRLTPREGESNPNGVLLRAGARLTRHTRRVGLCNATRQMLGVIGAQSRLWRKWMLTNPGISLPLLRWRWRGRTVLRLFFTQECFVREVSLRGGSMQTAGGGFLRFRCVLLPGRKTRDEEKRLRRLLGRHTELHFPVELDASPRSSAEGESWDALSTAIQIQFEHALCVPCLSPYVTDARFFAGLGGCVYRFSPYLLTEAEARACECVLTDDTLQTAVQFFRSMLSV